MNLDYEAMRSAAPEGIAKAFEAARGIPAAQAEEALVLINAVNRNLVHSPLNINECFERARSICETYGISYDDLNEFVRAYVPGQAMP